MKPYYQDDAVQIFHGDCREILPELPKADLLLTDPPYLQSKSGGGLIGRRETYQRIQSLSDFDPKWLCEQLSTVCKSAHGYIFCSKNLLCPYISVAETRGWGWDILVYAKNNPMPAKNNKYLTDAEFIIFFREPGKCYFNNDAPYENYFKVKRVNCSPSEFGHPTEKEIAVLKSMILVSTRPDDLVIDPYLGSGTLLRAAKDLGRKAIGIEIEEKYCEIAAKRMSQEVLQFA